MRQILLVLLFLPFMAQAMELRVVVHTRDRVVRVPVYQCIGSPIPLFPPSTQAQILSSGQVTWNVLGGLPPYQLISVEEHATSGFMLDRNIPLSNSVISVTVRDAEGNVATGTGFIQNRYEPIIIECPDLEAPPEKPTPTATETPSAGKEKRMVRTGGRTAARPRPKEDGPEPPKPGDRVVTERPDTPQPAGRPVTPAGPQGRR
ncbi:MAG: hypothetical protein JNM31_14750 [Flavobacteriales bacterium]|nr:hypothetical protein [Flavobacteriales bacterium]